MERDSIIYKFRRKIQIIAHRLFPDAFLSKVYFYIVVHKKLNLRNPTTFNEKIQWMKLYYYPSCELVIKATDKYLVRQYVKAKGYSDRLVPLLGVWNSADEIDWNQLPEQFVLKCNHGCAYNLIVSDKQTMDVKTARKQLDSWMKEDFGAFNIELHYSKIKPHRIICEEYLGATITDYKFFCFNGEPHFIYVSSDLVHDRQAKIGFFYLDGKKMPLIRDDYEDIPQVSFPPFFEEMIEAATVLCKDFPFVRVDFFITDSTWYFAELTFTPGAGMMPFNPSNMDLEWGNLLEMPTNID